METASIVLNRVKLICDKYRKINISKMETEEFEKYIRAQIILENTLEIQPKFGEVTTFDRVLLTIQYEKFYIRKIERHEEKKKIFDEKLFFSTMFYSTSLSADYGRFTCSNCGSIFYHSPSSIFKGRKLITANACGYCTNQYLNREIFE